MTVSAVHPLRLNANGLHFDALSAGPRHASLVLFLHGFPQFADAWSAILPSIADAGFHAVAVDQRGYSAEARPPYVEDYALDRLVSDALAFADALGAHQFHLVGHDWGGAVAWRLASTHPARLLSLTVLSLPHLDAFKKSLASSLDQMRRSRYIPHLDAFKKSLASSLDQMRRSRYILLFKLPGRIAEKVLLAFNARALRGAFQGKLPAAVIDENIRRLRTDGALTAALNWYRALRLPKSIGKVTTRTLYLWGTRDFALGEVAANATADYVTGPYRFERLEGRSHWLIEEIPTEITAHLLQHLGPASLETTNPGNGA